MACGCRKNKEGQQQQQESIMMTENITNVPSGAVDVMTLEPVTLTEAVESQTKNETTENVRPRQVPGADNVLKGSLPETVIEAMENNLKACYLCAKKHMARAQIFFEEYHTGYPDHIKNLMESTRVAEVQVRKAFFLWQRVMGHLDMAANELLGNELNTPNMNAEHIALANEIRNIRIKLSDNPLYSPNFNEILIKIHQLQHKALSE